MNDYHYNDHQHTLVEGPAYCCNPLHSHGRCRSLHHNLPEQYDQYDDKYADEYDECDDNDDGNHRHPTISLLISLMMMMMDDSDDDTDVHS